MLTLMSIGVLLAAVSPGKLAANFSAAVATYAALWLLAEAHYRLRGYEGLGLGDVKLAAAGALWVGPGAFGGETVPRTVS